MMEDTLCYREGALTQMMEPAHCLCNGDNSCPPSSETEIMATVQGQPCNGPWLLEGVLKGRLPVVVASVLVEP